MTTKPTLGANLLNGALVTQTEWDRDVLQNGRYLQEVLAGTNTDKIPDGALAWTALGTKVEAVLASDLAIGGLGAGNWYTILSISLAAGEWEIFGGSTFKHTAAEEVGIRVGAATPGYRYGDGVLVANTALFVPSRPFIVTLGSTTTIVMDGTSALDAATALADGPMTGGEATWLTAVRLK